MAHVCDDFTVNEEGPTTEVLLRRARADDRAARDALVARFLPILRRWARGRLPHYARDLAGTDDLVQITLIRAMNNLQRFEFRGTGSFLGYLRQILLNSVREEVRRSSTRGGGVELDKVDIVDDQASAVEQIAGAERLRDYEAALAELPRKSQELIVMRIEFGMSFPEIAAELGMQADAVRMAVSRALLRMTKRLTHVADAVD